MSGFHSDSRHKSENRFSCTLCGDCCTGAQVVRLNGGDLNLISRRKGLSSSAELKATALVSLVLEPVGEQRMAWRPRIRFRSHPLRQCPFLVNDVDPQGSYRGLCSLHPDAKPLVCALSPLSREVDDGGSGSVSETWSFVPPVVNCPGVGKGDPVPILAPRPLKSRLEAEVRWMRFLIERSPHFNDETAAWTLLAEAEALT